MHGQQNTKFVSGQSTSLVQTALSLAEVSTRLPLSFCCKSNKTYNILQNQFTCNNGITQCTFSSTEYTIFSLRLYTISAYCNCWQEQHSFCTQYSKTNCKHFLYSVYYELTASTCFEHYLLIFRRHYINNWYTAYVLCRMTATRVAVELPTLVAACRHNMHTKYTNCWTYSTSWDQPRDLLVRTSAYYPWGPGFDSRFYRGEFPLQGKIPVATMVWVACRI
jgi:hypothetical protein